MSGHRRPGVRLRFTVLYGTLFLASGAALLIIAGLLASGSVRSTRPAPGPRSAPTSLAYAQARIADLQHQLAVAQTAALRQFLLGSVVALCVMAVLSFVLGRFAAGRVLRPLRAMTAATRRITADRLHERLAVAGPSDEVKDLADTIDGLLERLEGAFAAQRRFVADASHELRTPLATMRASLDVAVAKPDPVPAPTLALAGRLRTELDQMDRLLDGFLTLARTQHGDLPDRAIVPLGDLAARSLAARAEAITAADLTVREALDRAGTDVRGSRTLLARMVDNLVDNAIRHNRPGGWVRVAATADTDAVRLTVETGGPALDPEQVARLARPFRRLGSDRTGSAGGAGLGLAIVAAIAHAHAGTLDLRARTEGGLCAEVTLPAAPRPGARAVDAGGTRTLEGPGGPA